MEADINVLIEMGFDKQLAYEFSSLYFSEIILGSRH